MTERRRHTPLWSTARLAPETVLIGADEASYHCDPARAESREVRLAGRRRLSGPPGEPA